MRTGFSVRCAEAALRGKKRRELSLMICVFIPEQRRCNRLKLIGSDACNYMQETELGFFLAGFARVPIFEAFRKRRCSKANFLSLLIIVTATRIQLIAMPLRPNARVL